MQNFLHEFTVQLYSFQFSGKIINHKYDPAEIGGQLKLVVLVASVFLKF